MLRKMRVAPKEALEEVKIVLRLGMVAVEDPTTVSIGFAAIAEADSCWCLQEDHARYLSPGESRLLQKRGSSCPHTAINSQWPVLSEEPEQRRGPRPSWWSGIQAQIILAQAMSEWRDCLPI